MLLTEASPDEGGPVPDQPQEQAPPVIPQGPPQSDQPSVDPERSESEPVDAHTRLRQLVSKDRILLSRLITITQQQRGGDPLLQSSISKAAMSAFLARLFDLDRDVAGRYGVVEFKPDQTSFGSLFDSIGQQQLAQYLGIRGIPNVLPSIDHVEPTQR